MKKENKKQKRFNSQIKNLKDSHIQNDPAVVTSLVSKKQILTTLFLIILVTIVAYLPALKNGFILWDDPEYVTKSPHIQEINFKKLFGEFYFSRWHGGIYPGSIRWFCLPCRGLHPGRRHLH